MPVDFLHVPLPGEPPRRLPLRRSDRLLGLVGGVLLLSAWGMAQVLAPLDLEAPAPNDPAAWAEPVAGDVSPGEATEAQALQAFDWPALFQHLEQGLSDAVELQSLEVRADSSRLKLVARAATAADALAAARRLAAEPGLHALRLTQQDPEPDTGTGRPAAVRVTLEGPWRPSGTAP